MRITNVIGENGITEYGEFLISLPEKKQQLLSTISDIIYSERFVINRKLELDRHDIRSDELPMGPGGVGQIKVMKDGSIRIQIGYGHGRYNYALVAII